MLLSLWEHLWAIFRKIKLSLFSSDQQGFNKTLVGGVVVFWGEKSRGISSTSVFGEPLVLHFSSQKEGLKLSLKFESTCVAGGRKKLCLISQLQALNLVTGGKEKPIKTLIKISLLK